MRIKKQYKYGLKFDSKLELYFYDLLKENKIKFDFQVPYELMPSFKYDGKVVRKCTLTIDFLIYKKNSEVAIVDTKGFQRPENALRFKMLKYLLFTTKKQLPVYLPKNQKECIGMIEILKKL